MRAHRLKHVLLVLWMISGVLPLTQAGAVNCSGKLVCDEGLLLNGGAFSRITEYHQALRERYDLDYRVVVQSHEGDIAQRAVSLFKEMNVGSSSKTKKGMLLLIDPSQNKVRLEISAGLDAVYTDGFVAYLQQRQMVPFFKANRVGDGVLATTELIVTRAQKAAKGEEFVPPQEVPQVLAIGAGAQTDADIGKGQETPMPGQARISSGGLTPLQVVEAYHQALAEKNTSTDLDIYSESTKQMRKQWVITPAQMASELAMYQGCDIDKVIDLKDKGLSVVRYKVEQRHCAPYYLIWENGGWKLNFAEMMRTIRFNVDNEWHVDMKVPSPYNDAYDDWSFNKNGYPYPMRKLRWGLTVTTNMSFGITYVKKIYPGTPAQDMGLKERDVIKKWNNIIHANYRQILDDMDRLKPGEVIQVEVNRDGQSLTIELTAPPYI